MVTKHINEGYFDMENEFPNDLYKKPFISGAFIGACKPFGEKGIEVRAQRKGLVEITQIRRSALPAG